MTHETRLFLVGPHQVYLDCLAQALTPTAPVAGVAAGPAAEVDPQVLACQPQALVVVDVGVTRQAGVGWIRQVTHGDRPAKVLALGSAEEQQLLLDCIAAGATGVHLKEEPLASLVGCIERMVRGESVCPQRLLPSLLARLAAEGRGAAADDDACLTLRERDIYKLLAEGLSNKQIATRLNLSLHTVKNHVHRVLEKLQAEDRIEIVKRAHAGPHDRRAR